MALGVWHFAAKSHIDVKRVYSRFGNIVSNNTVRKALDSMTVSTLNILRDSVRAATERGQTEWCLILDNVQENSPVYEGGIARESILKLELQQLQYVWMTANPALSIWMLISYVSLGWTENK